MLKQIFRILAVVFLGWLVFVPLAFLFPKKKMVVFLTRFGNTFDGNLKYLLLYLKNIEEKDIAYYFLTEKKAVQRELQKNKLPVLFYPGIKSFYLLLRAKIIVVDGNEWIRKLKYHLLLYSHKIQLWHGSGMKTIGLLKPEVKKRSFIINIISKLIGHHPYYNKVYLSSKFQRKTRGKAFRCKKIDINGQPRNDIFFKNNWDIFKLGIDKNLIEKCYSFKKSGYKIILYSPTWRYLETNKNSLEKVLDVHKLNKFAQKYKLLFIFKFHNKDEFFIDLSKTEYIMEYDRSKDIYPLFKITDCMITDYSSIYIDYLLLDKPVIFFPFDYDYYINKERALQFNYNDITPGPKCFSQKELEDAIEITIINQKDRFKKNRKETVSIFYDYIDGDSCKRIWTYIKNLP